MAFAVSIISSRALGFGAANVGPNFTCEIYANTPKQGQSTGKAAQDGCESQRLQRLRRPAHGAAFGHKQRKVPEVQGSSQKIRGYMMVGKKIVGCTKAHLES